MWAYRQTDGKIGAMIEFMREEDQADTQAEIHASPATLFWYEGCLAMVISLVLSAVGIQEIYALQNPEKLAYLQKQLTSPK